MGYTDPNDVQVPIVGKAVTKALADAYRENFEFFVAQAKVSAVVDGGPTSGEDLLTLATLNVADPGVPYRLDVAAFWNGTNNTAGDTFRFRIRVDGTTRASGLITHGADSERKLYSLPTIQTMALSAAVVVTVTVRRVLGTGTINTAEAGFVTATVMPRVT